MSDRPPIVAHWVCVNKSCSEQGILKDSYDTAYVNVRCGACQELCEEQAVDE